MFKTNVLRRYIFVEYSKLILKITLLFFALGIIINLFEEINFFKDIEVDFLFPVLMSVLKVPSMVYKIFPFIFLISSIMLFMKLIQSEEIIPIKIAGISNLQIILLPTLISFVFGIMVVTGVNTVTSGLTYKYLDIKNEFTDKNNYLAAITENGIWIKDKIDGNTNIISAHKLVGNSLYDVSVYQFNDRYEYIVRVESDEADISNNEWILKNATIYFKNKNNASDEFSEYKLLSNFEINSIKNLFSNLDSVSVWDLNKLKKNYNYAGYSTKQIDSEIQRALSYPFFLMSMTLLAGVVILNIKYRGNIMAYILTSVILSVLIFYINDFSKALGETEKISLIMSVWTPVILVFIISSIGMIYINEK